MHTAHGTRDPAAELAPAVTRARLLASLFGRAMSRGELARWVEENDTADAVEDLVTAGSVRRTRDGGLALHERRRDAALIALARDLRA